MEFNSLLSLFGNMEQLDQVQLNFNPRIFPPELQLGGMAMVAAWWGVWHIVSGLILAFYWRRRPVIARTNK